MPVAGRERPRIPIERVPQPREDKMSETWRLARPSRIGTSLEQALARNAGGWFVAGVSADVGRTESVTRTIAGREVVFWRDERGELVAGPGLLPAPRRADGPLPGDRRHDVLPLARAGADP